MLVSPYAVQADIHADFFQRSVFPFYLAGRLAGWLACWLADWLTIWLAGWLVGWLTSWLAGKLTGGQGDCVSSPRLLHSPATMAAAAERARRKAFQSYSSYIKG